MPMSHHHAEEHCDSCDLSTPPRILRHLYPFVIIGMLNHFGVFIHSHAPNEKKSFGTYLLVSASPLLVYMCYRELMVCSTMGETCLPPTEIAFSISNKNSEPISPEHCSLESVGDSVAAGLLG